MMDKASFYYFKGERYYAHSSNIFDFILVENKNKKPKNVDFRLTRITNKHWHLETAKPVSTQHLIGSYTDDLSSYYILESDLALTERLPYDEDGLARQFKIAENTITIPDQISRFTFIEKANAAFKTLLNSVAQPGAPARYFFVRLTLDHIPMDGFSIRFRRIIGNKFCEGDILEGTAHIGGIYFSKEKKV